MDAYTVDDLLKHQDFLARTGMANPNTSAGKKSAIKTLFSVLEPEEARDVRLLDVDTVFTRWVNKNPSGPHNPQSMQVYLSRAKSAVADFLKYRDNPAGYKPVAPAIKKPAPKPPAAREDQQLRSPIDRPSALGHLDGIPQVGMPGALVFSVPIRPGVVAAVGMNGLPTDLTAAEAARASKFIGTIIDSLLTASAEEAA